MKEWKSENVTHLYLMKGWATAKYLQRFSTSVSLQLYKLHINPFTQSPMCKYQKSTFKWSWWWLDSIFNQPQIFPFNKSGRTDLRDISFGATECIKWHDFLKSFLSFEDLQQLPFERGSLFVIPFAMLVIACSSLFRLKKDKGNECLDKKIKKKTNNHLSTERATVL